MNTPIVERECDRCHKPTYFYMEYQEPDRSVGIYGGWYGVALTKEEDWEGLDTSEREDNRCLANCYGEEELDQLEIAVGMDYEKGLDYEPY